MASAYVLYNPLAGSGSTDVKQLDTLLEETPVYYDITRITNYRAFLSEMQARDILVIAGGDGTLNRFINDTAGIDVPGRIFYFPIGTGNDFATDVGQKDAKRPFEITGYLQALPCVTVNGRRYRFLNGVGFGIDGYCCQVGDEKKASGSKKVNYTAIAIKGLLLDFKPRNAKITVDGKPYTYKKVWIAPTMYGRYYGGGMIPTPEQDRLAQNPGASLMLFHGAGRLPTLCVFPSIFKGAHIKHKKMVALHTGKDITVEFDRPTPLQIDGETIRDVTTYRVTV